MKNKVKKKGINVTVSPEAHKKMFMDGFKSVPRKNLREQVNIINNLDKDL